jgi:hypothetical protein
MVDAVTASVVAALKPVETKEPAEPKEPAVAKVEVALAGDMDKPEDVQAHAVKVERAQLKAAVDWNDLESVKAYHEAIAPKKEITPASAQATGHEPKKSADDEPTDEDVNGAIDRMCANAN